MRWALRMPFTDIWYLRVRMSELSMEISPVLEIGSANHICSLVEDNLGVSFLPDYVIKDGIKAGTITKLEVENFPVIVVIDSNGNNLYESGRAEYLAQTGGKTV